MKDYSSTNFPVDSEGRTYHTSTKKGEVANRILTVGDPLRAKRIATLLEQPVLHSIESKRGFTTITGKYQNELVSIIAIGMGTPVADMMVREVRATTTGPLLIVRFGSCGAIGEGKPGSVAVAADGSVMVTKNFDYWHGQYVDPNPIINTVAPIATEPSPLDEANKVIFTGFNYVSHIFQNTFRGEPYHISSIIPPDKDLTVQVVKSLEKELGEENVMTGLNASADSFYSSQGRQDIAFGDDNSTLIDGLRQKYPNCETLEMESGMFLHLAQTCSHQARLLKDAHPGPIRAAACAMVFFNRISNAIIPPDYVDELELKAGRAVLNALVASPL